MIVVYCTDHSCNKGVIIYHMLKALGYHNVLWYGGGLMEWEKKGLPLEGTMVSKMILAA